MLKGDIRWFFLVLAAVVLFTIFGLPFFSHTGHSWWSILVYAFLLCSSSMAVVITRRRIHPENSK